MKVLCFIDSLVSGGAQRQLVNLAVLLHKNNHQIEFVTYRRDMFYIKYLKAENIDVKTIQNNNYLQRIYNVRKYLRRYKGDIVISFLETPNFLACLSAIGHHKWKLITNELSAKPESFIGVKSKVYKWFERFSDWTVCNSKNAAEMWKKHYPGYAKKISTIYNPIVIHDIDNQVLKRRKTKRRIVIAASYQYLKNPIRLIEAVNSLNEREKEQIEIDWYGRREVTRGDTKAYDEAQNLIQEYNLSEVVRLHEETTEIYKEMQEADAIGLFSTVEGLPNAICEGMMLGKAIIMSKVSDYSVLVTKKNGFLCDPNDYKSIKNALSLFINTPYAEILKMGMESRRIANLLFTPDRIIEQWEALMRELAGQQ